MSVKIIIDSSTDITPEVQSRVLTVPLTLMFGTETYQDGIDITHTQFYEKLIESDVMPTTSQASPALFADMFDKLKVEGHEAVVITVSAKLSGTYQSAMLAAQDYENIHVVDSHSVAIGAGILTELALRLAEENKTAAEIVSALKKERKNIHIIAMLDTLEYLKRGGRISKATAFAGGLLSIKPVVSLRDGEVEILGKARGSRQGNNLLVKEIQSAGGVDFNKPLLLGYTGLTDALLQKYIQDSASLWENNLPQLRSTIIGSVVGTHVGPGAIAVAFFKNSSNEAQ